MLTAEADLLLSEAELRSLTGYARADKQLVELRRQGFYRARPSRIGGVILERAHYEAVVQGSFARPTTPPTATNSPQVRHVQRGLPGTRTPEAKAKAAATRSATNAAHKAQRTPEKIAATTKARAALVLHHANKRRALKLQRTPSWADDAAIRAVYVEATRLTDQTGVPHHVDHVIPLQGERVSGLHVETNLQVLPASENIRKRNRFEVT